ncbi:MAG: type 4a pilus biogenesis protein PilO [Colwellia sp.]
MKFDATQFDNLELDNIGQWPTVAKLALAMFIVILITFLGYMTLISSQMEALEREILEEKRLKESYLTKYHISANLDLFREQMIAAEEIFAHQLRQLPNSHEIPGLLDDITFVGTTSNLNFVKLEWQPEISKEIYIELPIDIEVVGSYHSFGQFVSKIAALPRIVTLHDFKIKIEKDKFDLLNLKLQAKTYRYQEKVVQ